MISNKVLLSLFLILLGTSASGATTINVGPGQTYSIIQSAIDAANADDMISVSEGTYYENLVVKKDGIFIIGKNKEKTIIDGQQTGSVIRLEANNVTVSGFTLLNNGGSGKEDAGITIYSADNNMVANSIIMNNNIGVAIYSTSNNNVITGNYIKSNYRNGIFVFNSIENKIYNNNIQNNKIGIYADSARTNRIYSNNFIDNTDQQAYDNSGLNSWDDGSSGNFWNTHKAGGAYTISGVPKAKDNYPLSSAVTIKYETVPTDQKQKDEASKSSPGFSGLSVAAMLIVIGILVNKKRI